MKRYPVLEPAIGEREKKYVRDCMETGWVSSWGKYIGKFEAAFGRFLGVRHALSTSNGTVSLHLVMLALGIGPGDEVIVPDFTYVASANAVRYVVATPVFVDCDAPTFNIEPQKIEEKITPRTRAIMVVHLYGNPCRMDEIMRIAARRRIPVVEDAAEAHGSLFGGRKVGSFGLVNSFSFFGNKTITTGEGGMVVTNSKKIAERVALLKNQGQPPNRRKYFHPVMGYNYRMINLEAAIGLGQLERIGSLLKKKQAIHRWYRGRLAPLIERGIIAFQQETPGSRASWWVNTIVLCRTRSEQLASKLKRAGVDTRPFFLPMHELPHLRQAGSFPNSRMLSRAGLILPSSTTLEERDVEIIAGRVLQALGVR